MTVEFEKIEVGDIIKITKTIVIGDQTKKELCDIDLNGHLLLITNVLEIFAQPGPHFGADAFACDFIVISENKDRRVKNFMFYYTEMVIWSD